MQTKIDELAEKCVEAIRAATTSDPTPEQVKIGIASVLRAHLPGAAGVELRTTEAERDTAFHGEFLLTPALTQFSMDAVCDIDALLLALAARDAEIDKLKEIEKSAKQLIAAATSALVSIEYLPMILNNGDSAYPTCPACHARSYGSRSTEPHKASCVIKQTLNVLGQTDVL